ncbi:TetR family transcriptional regulator [Pseudooceanicola lipolyticus]|uniref:TetR family transcriptional regulator n=1 Tax=Pseudooceanicola lipolyticus TaxID=2029104 RepID=A0A2M8J189_9RHOB|nr:TetR/AcrR family transcriptional regulator [Pseudooceanicola lipolyticus]PJE36518.1 TetR family transcriptional regulator [Pseudooceanicola lipolyticus]
MSQDKRKPGRPPSPQARARALKAAQEILLRDGFGRLTIEAVATASGTGKPTIYRHWANATELAMEALIADTDPVALPDSRTAPRAALMRQLDRLVTAFSTTRGRQIALALASADPDSEFTRAFRNRVILACREDGRALIERVIAADNLTAPPDLDVLLDMIYGPLFFRLLAGHQPLDRALPGAIVDTAFAALTPSPSAPGAVASPD